MADLFVVLICVGPLLAMLVITAIASRGAPKLNNTTVGLAVAGAFVGWVLLIYVRVGFERVLHPGTAEFDVLAYFVFPSFGAVLGMTTVFLWALRQDLTRVAARNLLLVVSVVVIPFHIFNLYELATFLEGRPGWRNTVFWMSDSALPLLWLTALWVIWARHFARPGTEEAPYSH
jgi:hypothetical protein